MKKIYLRLILISGFISLLLSSCINRANSLEHSSIDYLSVDEKPDSTAPAGIEELQINSSGSILFGFEYVANGPGPHPTVIMLHGLPGNERNLDLAQNLRRAGYNIIFFNYSGSWGSKGTFSFANSLKDVDAVLDYITDDANISRMRIDTGKIALVGHSMGAGLAVIAGINDPRVKAIAGISVFNPYTILKGNGSQGNIHSLKEYISTLGMLNCEPNTYLKELIAGLNSYDIETMIVHSKKPLLVIDEHKNNNYLANHIDRKHFTYKMWNTDHAFTNKRIALSVELNNWLRKNISR
jgi:uncharacterized protein